jgi:chemotaxis protein MotB
MKKSFHFIALSFLIFSMLLTSCGPGKKLVSSRVQVNQLEKENADKQSQLENTQSQLNDCNLKVKGLNQSTSTLQNENAAVLNDLRALSAESKMTIADQAKRLKTLQDMIQAQMNVMENLKNSIADALMNYKSDELSIYTKDGNVYVSLEEKLLFKSGSDVVDPKGKEALKFLAQVLNNTKNITVMIEGHTDNVPIKTKLMQDNWDLSSARATAIVRILTMNNGFDPGRITASGRGEFHPVKTNDTVEGRASNRRTEIILSPNMKELYNLIYQ